MSAARRARAAKLAEHVDAGTYRPRPRKMRSLYSTGDIRDSAREDIASMKQQIIAHRDRVGHPWPHRPGEQSPSDGRLLLRVTEEMRELVRCALSGLELQVGATTE